ncbi:hypothetical protein CRYUN_Cryun25bG0055800 [Craigia yunnanensis]
MAAQTPKKQLQSPNNLKLQSSPPSVSLSPQTPQSLFPPQPPLRRSSRRTSLSFTSKAIDEKPDPKTPKKAVEGIGICSGKSRMGSSKEESVKTPKTPKFKSNEENRKIPKLGKLGDGTVEVEATFSPVSPTALETRKRKREEKKSAVTRDKATRSSKKKEKEKKRVYYKKVV